MTTDLSVIKETAAYKELVSIDAELNRIGEELRLVLSPDFDPSTLNDGLNLKRSPTIAERVVRAMEATHQLINRRLTPAEVIQAIQAYDDAHREQELKRAQMVIAREIVRRIKAFETEAANIIMRGRATVPASIRDRVVDLGVPHEDVLKIEGRYRIPDEDILAWWKAQHGEVQAEEPDELDRINALEAAGELNAQELSSG